MGLSCAGPASLAVMTSPDPSAVDPAAASQPFQTWPYEDLRRAAFDRAKQRRDIGFFVGLYEHTTAMSKTVDEGGSLGEIGGTLTEMWEGAQQLFGRDGVGELEPMYRAVFIDYLTKHGLGA